jgi:hypothetical protein
MSSNSYRRLRQKERDEHTRRMDDVVRRASLTPEEMRLIVRTSEDPGLPLTVEELETHLRAKHKLDKAAVAMHDAEKVAAKIAAKRQPQKQPSRCETPKRQPQKTAVEGAEEWTLPLPELDPDPEAGPRSHPAHAEEA